MTEDEKSKFLALVPAPSEEDLALVAGENKARDFAILTLFREHPEITNTQMAEIFGLSTWRISDIVTRNLDLIEQDARKARAERVRELKRQLALAKDTEKDKLEVLEALRKEYEKSGPVVNVDARSLSLNIEALKSRPLNEQIEELKRAIDAQ